jgi:hypothetical protein
MGNVQNCDRYILIFLTRLVIAVFRGNLTATEGIMVDVLSRFWNLCTSIVWF